MVKKYDWLEHIPEFGDFHPKKLKDDQFHRIFNLDNKSNIISKLKAIYPHEELIQTHLRTGDPDKSQANKARIKAVWKTFTTQDDILNVTVCGDTEPKEFTVAELFQGKAWPDERKPPEETWEEWMSKVKTDFEQRVKEVETRRSRDRQRDQKKGGKDSRAKSTGAAPKKAATPPKARTRSVPAGAKSVGTSRRSSKKSQSNTQSDEAASTPAPPLALKDMIIYFGRNPLRAWSMAHEFTKPEVTELEQPEDFDFGGLLDYLAQSARPPLDEENEQLIVMPRGDVLRDAIDWNTAIEILLEIGVRSIHLDTETVVQDNDDTPSSPKRLAPIDLKSLGPCKAIRTN